MSQTIDQPYELAAPIREALAGRSIVLVGLMGAGKSAVGKRLAKRLELAFIDADTEIEAAAGKSISDIFAEHGEQHFRDGERRVIARLLTEGPQVLATGGGAFMDEETRARIREAGVSLWLKADLDVLVRRVRKRNHRPLLKDRDPRKVLAELIEVRYPVYARADITVHSRDVPHEVVVEEAIAALAMWLGMSATDAG
ncbi:MAG: shikimate kinase [Rhizobiales bacterium]|nr:shikimate kinase [Hyphomicrobiales bacterium]